MLIDSLNTALLTKQTELAASVASDLVENAKAIGQGALSAVTPPTNQNCTPTYSASTYGTATVPVPIPVFTAANIGQCFTIYVDDFLYAVTPTLTLPTTAPVAPEAIKVQVTWLNGSNTDSYFTYGIIGS